MIPPIGILSIFIGYHMRVQFPEMSAGQAFPQFILNYLPPALGGVFLATLLIAIVGTGSGMALGFGRIITNDIYKRYINPRASGKQQLLVTRIVILAALVVSALFTLSNLGSAILTFGFLSMGLRAVVLLVPMLTALFLPGRIKSAMPSPRARWAWPPCWSVNGWRCPMTRSSLGSRSAPVSLCSGLYRWRSDVTRRPSGMPSLDNRTNCKEKSS